MGATPAVDVLVRSETPFQLHEYKLDPHATSYGLGAAEALGLDPARVLKTLVVSGEGSLFVCVVPAVTELDLKAAAQVLGVKRLELAASSLAERTTGYLIGGISPLGQKRALPTLVDTRATEWPTIFVSGGRRGLELELAPSALVVLTNARLEPIARS